MAEKQNPLLELEKWATETHYVRRQVGFCAQWCLDNLCKYTVLLSNTIIYICVLQFASNKNIFKIDLYSL